jgi:RNA polymerase sigma factor (TIGR02999 family)
VSTPDHHVSELILAANAGSQGAVEGLYAALYADLRAMAHARLRGGGGPALLNTTALVHESFVRLVDQRALRLADRSHFLRYAGRVMRSVVVDLVREGQAERRGGGQLLAPLDTDAQNAMPASNDEVLRVHEALAELASIDERLVRVVELRYFMGLEMQEIADVLGAGKRTIERDWEKARSFLFASLRRA